MSQEPPKLLDEPAINWAGGYRPESMNERRSEYIAALRAADGHVFDALLEFVGAHNNHCPSTPPETQS